MTRWIDISQPLTNDMAHWPGDTPFEYGLTYSKEDTGSVNIGQITTSLHIGTHVDAPFHFDDKGTTINALDINTYIGKALIVDVSVFDPVTPEALKNVDFSEVERVLLRTSLPNDPKVFPEDMPILDPSLAGFLHEKGVKLLGVDIPSVDPPESKSLAMHHALHEHSILILENLMLDHVDPGLYELIALPLAIQDADGSPVRAVIKPVRSEGHANE
ncbi:Arylformamidase [Lentibacillus sp. JNUCC-1]|uniref:arylformamidase n=1 Tax=Lentibacillus sp. JNUCC-1 TaxID=2654513 RepID=UPI0012E777F9|nr:arylformamidase [Lentibacillus sp. JNUCC-1]MUV38650.1 Arylformamidase [Lentibacillus sp. JNUCC-1]